MITSVQNPLIKEVTKLHHKKHRDATQRFFAEGEHLALEAKKHNQMVDVFVTVPHPAFPNAIEVSPHVMKKISDTKHIPEVLTICHKRNDQQLTDKVLILENVQDPGNVGTLLRSALAFGFKTIVFDQSADPYSPKVVRATQGAIFMLTLVEMSVADFKKTNGDYTLIAAVPSDETPPNYSMKPPFALILGNEGQGIKTTTLEQADACLNIPIENVESLNVAVAGSILMYLISR